MLPNNVDCLTVCDIIVISHNWSFMTTPSTIIKPKKPVNYCNNKDMLREIHLSKNSYCSFAKPEDHRYDVIVEDIKKINKTRLAEAKKIRATRLTLETGAEVKPSDVKDTDVIFRVMTWEHVPLAPKQPRKQEKKRKAADIFEFEEEDSLFEELEEIDAKTKEDVDDLVHVKVNFPPFQHFKYTRFGNLKCVGKSHWLGDLKDGEFCKDHGQITNTLAKMYMEMCNRYATKYNWRGYTYNDEMRGSAIVQLTYVGLRFNEAKSDNPFAYYTAAITNSFCRVLNSEKRNQNIRDDILEMNGLNPSWSRQNSGDKSKQST